jgi:4-aminobutyrate aminotransferase
VEHFGVEPDILCCAKPIGGGLPLGAMIARKELHVWPSGAHANTFGGNPLACAAGLRTIELIEDGLMDNAKRMGEVLAFRAGPALRGVRPRRPVPRPGADAGHRHPPRQAGAARPRPAATASSTRRSLEGLLLLGCGEGGIRFLPSLTVERGHIEAALDVLRKALKTP